MASLVSKGAFIVSLAYFFYSKEGIKNKSLKGMVNSKNDCEKSSK